MSLTDICTKHGVTPPAWSECGDGWLPLIDRLMGRLVELGWDKDLQQVKEKWGGLRFYIGCGDEKIWAAVDEAEAESYKTCETCGTPGHRRTQGWVKTLCDACQKEREKAHVAFRIE